jgi:hypothetical protein
VEKGAEEPVVAHTQVHGRRFNALDAIAAKVSDERKTTKNKKGMAGGKTGGGGELEEKQRLLRQYSCFSRTPASACLTLYSCSTHPAHTHTVKVNVYQSRCRCTTTHSFSSRPHASTGRHSLCPKPSSSASPFRPKSCT